MYTILVLGGYGFFGSHICQTLAENKKIHLLIGGRNIKKAQALATDLSLKPDQGLAVDAYSRHLTQQLADLNINTVIHTAGPFQGQDYTVALACIHAGVNYIDLADGREFVAGITQLNVLASTRGVFVTSGASSLPALSSAVVDRYVGRFSRLDTIQHGIASGARAPGLATMRGIFAYCGKPFLRLKAGSWKITHGWLDLQCYRFPAPVGLRLLGSCDVPDLVLFPSRYPGVSTVFFHAGFASIPGHLFVWGASQLTRIGLMPSLNSLVKPLHIISQWLEPLISDKGAMFVSLEGMGVDGQPLKLNWHLVASQNHGPYIPCGAAIALVKKLVNNIPLPCGAMPCMGLLTVEDYLESLSGFNVEELPA